MDDGVQHERGAVRRVVWMLCGAAALVGCGSNGSTSATDTVDNLVPQDGTAAVSAPELTESADQWKHPGLVDAAGRPVAVEAPARSTGKNVFVADYGADPKPNSGDDAAAIRAALAAAEVGDTVVLAEGTFDLHTSDPAEPSTNVLLRSGVRLSGAGSTMTVLVSDFDGEDNSAVLLAKAVEDVVVDNLTVSSTYDGPLGVDPKDDTVGGGPMFGIQIGERNGAPSVRVLIEDVRVERFQRHGISLKATREVIVRRCHVGDATSVGPGGAGYGIAVEGRADQRDTEATNDSRHNVVTDNVLDGTHLRHPILLQFPTHNNLIADNLVVGSVLDAIDVHGEGEYLNEIRGNTIYDGSRAAIALGNSGGAKHQHGASGEGNWIHHNDLIANNEGVVVILGTPNTLVEANRIVAGESSEVGVRVDDAPGTLVRANVVVTSGDFEPFVVDGSELEIARNLVE